MNIRLLKESFSKFLTEQTNLINDVIEFFESKGFKKKSEDFWTSPDGKDVRIQHTNFSQNKSNVEIRWGYWKRIPIDLFNELQQKYNIIKDVFELDVSEGWVSKNSRDNMIIDGYRYVISGVKQMQESEQDMHRADVIFNELSSGNFLPQEEDQAIVDRMVKDGMIDTDRDELYWFNDRGFQMIKSSSDLYNKYFVESSNSNDENCPQCGASRSDFEINPINPHMDMCPNCRYKEERL